MPNTAQETKYNSADYSSIADYSAAPAYDIMQRDMQRRSHFQSLFGDKGYVKLTYDEKQFPFGECVKDMLYSKGILDSENVARHDVKLAELHRYLNEEQTSLDSSSINAISRHFYETDAAFFDVYKRFAANYLTQQVLKEDCIFQKQPTMRFYFPHAKGFNWRLNYHTDIMLGHPPQEINVWYPLTRAFGSNSMRIATLPDSLQILARYGFSFYDYQTAIQNDDALLAELHDKTMPVEAEPGEVLLFDSRCLHVLQNNKTDATRISMDLRIMPLREYEALEMPFVGTGRRRMPFAIGEYYSPDILRYQP
jgi:hypothetical protein